MTLFPEERREGGVPLACSAPGSEGSWEAAPAGAAYGDVRAPEPGGGPDRAGGPPGVVPGRRSSRCRELIPSVVSCGFLAQIKLIFKITGCSEGREGN